MPRHDSSSNVVPIFPTRELELDLDPETGLECPVSEPTGLEEGPVEPGVGSDRDEIDEIFGTEKSEDSAEKVLKYAILASVLLHIIALASMVYVSNRAWHRPVLKPGEKVERVKLVEFQQPKKPEPPPKKASAISDRNHTAKVERRPKRISPLGRITPYQRPKMAALPPKAPEDLIKPEPKKKPVPKPVEPKTKPRVKSKPKPKPKQEKLLPDRDARVEKRIESDRPREIPLDRMEHIARRGMNISPTARELDRAVMASQGSSVFDPDGDPDVAVVDMNSRETRYFSYLLHLKHKIQAAWSYPASANGLAGSLTVEIEIANNGRLVRTKLLDSSGHNILDQSAIRAIRTAAPFYPFPPRLKAKRLRVRGRFIYANRSNFRGFR